MARLAKIIRNNHRKEMSAKYAALRAELKETVRKPASDDARDEALLRLQKLPRDSSKTRIRNRCAVSGRARGYHRKFGLSRIALRMLGLEGKLPGVRKSSW
jgi:small subunit ribosomal protein S14